MSEFSSLSVYDCIRARMLTEFPEDSDLFRFQRVMTLVYEGIVDAVKADPTERYGGHLAGLDPTAGPGSRNAGRPGGA